MKKKNIFTCMIAISVAVMLSSCGTTTVLLANFGDDAISSPPASAQTIGSIAVTPGNGTVSVVASPNLNLPANKWALISHPSQPSEETTMTGHFSRAMGPGKYGLLSSLFIPAGSGVVTVQFEAVNSQGSFLHIDFMAEGDVRIDDDNSKRFGQFARDRAIVLSVALNITPTTATAEISILGDNTSGDITVNINPLLVGAARNFGAVKYWIGFQHRASFFVDNIIVTRKN